MIVRLRDKMSAMEMEKVYAVPHDAKRWADHVVRVDYTIQLGRTVAVRNTVADLSCGNGSIANGITADLVILGDYAGSYQFQGDLVETLPLLGPSDLYVCTETLEHVDDPELVLSLIKQTGAATLLLSTPVDCFDDDNPEHYWAWDQAGVEELLTKAGWTVQEYSALDLRKMQSPYIFGCWLCH